MENTQAGELYSNGLRVDNRFAADNQPRAYLAASAAAPDSPVWEARTAPAGIVFHTTESHLVAFEAGRTRELNSVSESLLDYVRRNRSYHFLIDRFGRVHRIVQETDSANHAGRSVWADEEWIYLNLNDSFLGVAFEAQDRADRGQPSVSEAQISAGKALTEMLLSKYHIRPENCVAHGQVSVSSGSRRIAYHSDWAFDLPFRDLGLPDNYGLALPSLYLFGFGYDSLLDDPSQPGLWRGLRAARQRVCHDAAVQGIPVARYQAGLQHRYRDIISALERKGAGKEGDTYERQLRK